MILAVGVAFAGEVIEVRRSGEATTFDVVARTPQRASQIVNWEGRPLELMIVADLSVSVVLKAEGPGDEMKEALLAAYHAMQAHPVEGDQLGVTVFGGNARLWVPLGPLDRPGLDNWLAMFGRAQYAPLPWATAEGLKPGEWREEPTAPGDLGLEAFDTDPATGIQTALGALDQSSKPLKAIVVLWDGEQTTPYAIRHLLDRVWSHEIHIYTIAVGNVHREGLDARGGGDVYLSGGHASLAMERIIDQLRMPPEPASLGRNAASHR